MVPPSGAFAAESGKIVRFEGVVCSVDVKDYATVFTVKTGKEKVLVRVKRSGDESRRSVYDCVGRRVSVSGSISLPAGRRNPKCFDYRRYLRGKGIYSICDTNKYKFKAYETVFPLRHAVSCLKAGFYDYAEKYAQDGTFGMITGILFGDTSYMDEDFYESFRSNGIAHILAVSGLHVNMTYDLVRLLFRKRKGLGVDMASVFILFVYAALSGFSVSVLRASLMTVLKILAFHTDRRYDSLSAVTFTASAMIAANPYLIYDSGMQLSFSAAYTMAALYPWMLQKSALLADKTKSESVYRAGKFLTPGLAAFCGTAPLCAFHYSNFTLLSLLLNPLAIAAAGIIVPLGLIGFILSSILPPALSAYALYIDVGALNIFCTLLKWINGAGAFLAPDTSVVSPPSGMLIIYYILLFFTCSETRYVLRRKRSYKALAVLGSVLLTAGVTIPFALNINESIFPWEYGTAKITFLDVGQGDCIHIHYGGKDILIDGGGSYYTNVAEKTIKPYLLKNGIKSIDLAIVTHEDMDHSKGIYELGEIFEIKKVLRNTDVYGETGLEENDCCIVASADIDGCVFLFMSDADKQREEYLLKAYPSLYCDVLKVAHHGSANSTGAPFLRKISPSLAVFSVGANNNYGHPAPGVIELLDSCGIIYARTDTDGAISLRKSGSNEFVFVNAAKDKVWHIPRRHP